MKNISAVTTDNVEKEDHQETIRMEERIVEAHLIGKKFSRHLDLTKSDLQENNCNCNFQKKKVASLDEIEK